MVGFESEIPESRTKDVSLLDRGISVKSASSLFSYSIPTYSSSPHIFFLQPPTEASIKMMEYFSSKRARSKSPAPPTQVETPVLNEEDEAFLARIETEGTPPELPERPAPPLPSRPQDDLPYVGETAGNNA